MEKISRTDRVENEELHTAKGKKEHLTHRNEGRLTGLVKSCVETVFLNTSLKEI